MRVRAEPVTSQAAANVAVTACSWKESSPRIRENVSRVPSLPTRTSDSTIPAGSAGTQGTLDAEGNYQLATGTGPSPKSGAPVGRYKVGVVAMKEPVRPVDIRELKGMPPPPEPLIPVHYNNPDTSGLTIEVSETPSADAYVIKLSS